MGERVGDGGGRPAPAGDRLVAVEGLTKRYSLRLALEDLAVSLDRGEVFGLVGGNGGGKTTALRLLAGLLRPDRGHGHVLGLDLLRDTREIRRHVGYMSQRLSLYADLSVLENLRFRAQVFGAAAPRAAAEAAMHDFGLTGYARAPAGRLSGGWARRLQLAAAMIHAPRLLLLDEPTAGLDAASRQEVWQRIGAFAAAGAGAIVSTHDLAEAEWCSRTAFLSEGRVLAAGTPGDVARSAPAVAFLLSGGDPRQRARSVAALPGVIATYPEGMSLRVVADAGAEARLLAIARDMDARLVPTAMRLEDAALAFAPGARDPA